MNDSLPHQALHTHKGHPKPTVQSAAGHLAIDGRRLAHKVIIYNLRELIGIIMMEIEFQMLLV